MATLPANFSWYVERERIGIVEWAIGNNISTATSPTSVGNGLKATFLVTKKAPDFTADLNEQSHLPPEFHEALAYRVISQGYMTPKNLNPQLAQMFESMYQARVKEAKKYARMKHIGVGRIIPQDF